MRCVPKKRHRNTLLEQVPGSRGDEISKPGPGMRRGNSLTSGYFGTPARASIPSLANQIAWNRIQGKCMVTTAN